MSVNNSMDCHGLKNHFFNFINVSHQETICNSLIYILNYLYQTKRFHFHHVLNK